MRNARLNFVDETFGEEVELSHGGISGRTAQQFINHLMGLQA